MSVSFKSVHLTNFILLGTRSAAVTLLIRQCKTTQWFRTPVM